MILPTSLMITEKPLYSFLISDKKQNDFFHIFNYALSNFKYSPEPQFLAGYHQMSLSLTLLEKNREQDKKTRWLCG